MHHPPVYLSSHKLMAISYPPFQHPVKGLLFHSVLHSVVNTSLGSSFVSLSWPSPSLCFVSWDLLYICLFWNRFLALESTISSFLEHKPNPQSHLCSNPSIVPLKAGNMCFTLQALCDFQIFTCWICYTNLYTRAQSCTTQGSLLALSREIQ